MRSFTALCAWLLFPGFLPAHDIQIGDTLLHIPIPEGCAAVTPEMKPYYDIARHGVPESNVSFVLFLSEDMTKRAAAGEIPDADRRFEVQTARPWVDRFVSKPEFAELKRLVKTENAELIRKAETQMPGLVDKISQGISAEFDLPVNLAAMRIIPLPAHRETERSLACSMWIRFNVDTGGNTTPAEAVTTTTFVYLQGKLLFLYVAAEKNGLEWSRTRSREWADAIIAANPSGADIARREDAPPGPGRDLDWTEVAKHAIIGGIIGGVLGLGAWMRKRFRNRTASPDQTPPTLT